MYSKIPIYRFVTCSGYYKKNKDLWHIFVDGHRYYASKDNLKNEIELEVGGDTVHNDLYTFVEEPFDGFLVGVINLTVSKDIGPDFDDAVDTGLGVIPERYYIGKWNEKIVKVGKVYIKGNNHFRYVPVDCINGG